MLLLPLKPLEYILFSLPPEITPMLKFVLIICGWNCLGYLCINTGASFPFSNKTSHVLAGHVPSRGYFPCSLSVTYVMWLKFWPLWCEQKWSLQFLCCVSDCAFFSLPSLPHPFYWVECRLDGRNWSSILETLRQNPGVENRKQNDERSRFCSSQPRVGCAPHFPVHLTLNRPWGIFLM